jgi:hypothetical protein
MAGSCKRGDEHSAISDTDMQESKIPNISCKT